MNLKQTIFMNVTISVVFSITIGFFMLVINAGGIAPGFLMMWLKSIVSGIAINLPLSFLIIPPIHSLAKKLFMD